jgi:hypothetical protein
MFRPPEYVLWDVIRSAGLRGTGASGGGITAGTTLIPACTSKFLVADASSTVNCSAAFVADSSGSGNGVFTFRKTTATAVTDNTGFLDFQGTLTAPVSGTVINGMAWWVAGVGSGAFVQRAMDLRFQAGYTGAAATVGASYQNQAAGTGTDWIGGYTSTTAGGNWGTLARANATTTGSNVGTLADARGGQVNVGVVGLAITSKSNATNVGGVFEASQTTGTPVVTALYAGVKAGIAPTFVSSALQLDNAAIAVPILVAQDNATEVFRIANDGALQGGITKTLTDNTIATFAILNLGNDTGGGGTIHYCVYAQDATTAGLECGSIDFAGVDVTTGAGGEVCTNPVKIGTPIQALSGSTLAVTFAATTGTDLCNLRVTADTNIATPVTLNIRYTIMSQSGNLITPQ